MIIAIFNPTIVTSLKVLCIITFVFAFFMTMTTYTATIEKNAIHYTKKFFSYTISHRVVAVETIEKFEKIRHTMKLHQTSGKAIHFALYSPEFMATIEEFSAQHAIPMVEKGSRKIKTN